MSSEALFPTVVVGAASWNRVDESYAVTVNVAAGSIADLGTGVVTDSSQTPIGSISAASVAQVNWGSIRVRSV